MTEENKLLGGEAAADRTEEPDFQELSFREHFGIETSFVPWLLYRLRAGRDPACAVARFLEERPDLPRKADHPSVPTELIIGSMEEAKSFAEKEPELIETCRGKNIRLLGGDKKPFYWDCSAGSVYRLTVETGEQDRGRAGPCSKLRLTMDRIDATAFSPEEKEAFVRFIKTRFSFLPFDELSFSSNGVSWDLEYSAWNNDDSWTEYQSFTARRIPWEEYEKNRFSQEEPNNSRRFGVDLRECLKGLDTECYFRQKSSEYDQSCSSILWSRADEAYLLKIPGCYGPFYFAYRSGSDQD